MREPTHASDVAPRALSADEARALGGSTVVLDVRSEAEFARGHVPGSGCVPLSDLARRRAELPPPEAPVLVVAENPGDAVRAAEALAGWGRRDLAYLASAWSSLAPVPDLGPPARLWRPARFLEEVAPDLPRGAALDVACGAGRDAVFLALTGFAVQAWDHDAEALAAAEELARRNGVSIALDNVDLESDPPPVIEARFALVICFRFLHRPLLPVLERALQPGGHLVYETYREGQERFGKPRRERFLLRAGELRSAFPSLEILRYEEPDAPQGPLTSRLLARRPAR